MSLAYVSFLSVKLPQYFGLQQLTTFLKGSSNLTNNLVRIKRSVKKYFLTLNIRTEKKNLLFEGLPGMLFSLMDYEVDPCVLSDIHDTITSIMHSMVADKLTSWLHLCREASFVLFHRGDFFVLVMLS